MNGNRINSDNEYYLKESFVRKAITKARISTVYQKCPKCNALVRTVQNVLEEDTLLRELEGK